jgi:hypothetical protein
MFLYILFSFTNKDCSNEYGYCRTNVYDPNARQNVTNYTCSDYALRSNVEYLNEENLIEGLCIEYRNSQKSIVKYALENTANSYQCTLRFRCINDDTCTPAYFIHNQSFSDFQYTSCIDIKPINPPYQPPYTPNLPSPPLPPGFPASSCDDYSFKESLFDTPFSDKETGLKGSGRLNIFIGSQNPTSPIKNEYVFYSNHVYNKIHDGSLLEFVEKPRIFPGILNTELVNSRASNPISECCYYCSNPLIFRKCGGFNVHVNKTNIECRFVSTQENLQVSDFYLNYSFDENSRHKRSFSYTNRLRFTTGLTQSSPPSIPPLESPSSSIPPWYLTFLQPEIFIPSLVGGIILLIVFIYLFRECTSERANAFSSVIDSILGRQKTEIIVT